jgi:hypothetical protein
MTVIIHGNGLEAEDFAAMRAAPSTRFDGTGDGLGAKLVWSPLSNLLLYGQTASRLTLSRERRNQRMTYFANKLYNFLRNLISRIRG